MAQNAWKNFQGDAWKTEINVRQFIQDNYTPYENDGAFLTGPTEATKTLLDHYDAYLAIEQEKGVVDMETDIVSQVNAYAAAYVDQSLEKIVGLQTDKPLKRAFHPFGGINVAVKAAEAYGYDIQKQHIDFFSSMRKTHNQGVFDIYTKEMRQARKTGIITGLPDGYGRGRIIGDYRRVALYGIDHLIAIKRFEKEDLGGFMNEKNMRLHEEIEEQIRALKGLIDLGKTYGFDLTRPAETAQEAIQWTYLAYLGAIQEQNGAAMSLGRVSTFLDIYIKRDMDLGLITETDAQELIDQFILKLRMVRFARTPEYNELFTGDPNWVTESIGGMSLDGRPLVTKNSFRFLQTLYNLNAAPEPNLTVLWSNNLPDAFKRFVAQVSIDTSSIQYENDDLMRDRHGDDYAISCCVSPMAIGKEMQFFGARANLAKGLLYAINGGKDEILNQQIMPAFEPVGEKTLDFDDVMKRFDHTLEWLASLYVNTLNAIHYSHDKYAYERLQMALHDRDVVRNFATGIAGLSVVADSLSAIKYAKVTPIKDETGLVVDYDIVGDFPHYGNNDDRVDTLAVDVVSRFMSKIRQNPTYRESRATMSVLTITSNVVYGKKTGNTPDGRKYKEAFAPGANPMHGRDVSGALASLLSVAKLPFEDAADGISNTFTIIPQSLGNARDIAFENAIELDLKQTNLVDLIDGYFLNKGHHLNVNVLNREKLHEALNHPERYPNLTIRVSGYAVKFNALTHEQKLEVISRTFHDSF